MIDSTGKVYLIEVNTNPCLEMNCTLLSRLIPMVLDNAFKFKTYLNLVILLKNCN